jgi:nucleoid-associated protein
MSWCLVGSEMCIRDRVFIVRDEEGIIFKRDNNGDFEVDTTIVVNTNKLAMAVRIDLEKLRLNEDRHLHFTKKQVHLSQYFFDWIEADLAEKSTDDTNKLVQLINKLKLEEFPINPENNERFTPDEFRDKIYQNILSSGRIVRIRELSKTFWDNEDFLTNKFEELEIEISNEFQAPESILKRLKKYEISSGKLKLSFTQNDIDSGRVSKGEGYQIIIDSEELLDKFNSI